MRKDTTYFIRDCNVIPDENCLLFKGTSREKLQPKVIEVLNLLAKNYPRVISREEIIHEIWDDNAPVGEQALTNAIWNLRQIFRKYYGEIPFISTIHKSGYKLSAKPVFHNIDTVKKNSRRIDYRLMIIISIFVTTILLIATFLYPNKIQEPEKIVVESITTESGREVFPALSPDNRHVAFKWVRAGYSIDLYMKDLTQPDLPIKRLTFDDEPEGAPVWSADGKHLYFQKFSDSSNNADCKIVELTLLNGAEKTIANCAKVQFPHIAISDDGTQLAYLTLIEYNPHIGIAIIELNDLAKSPRIIACNSNCKFINRDLSFSKDGQKLAVARRFNEYNENIFIIDLKSGAETQITNEFYDIVGLTWHSDNRHIIFGAQYSDFRKGFMVNIDSKVIKPLGIDGFAFPNINKNNDFLLYHDRASKSHIGSLSLAKDKKSTLFPLILSDYSHKNQDYSKIHNKITYTSNQSGSHEIWVSDILGKVREQLTFLEKELTSPKWSNNGKLIAFSAPNEKHTGNLIYILNVETKKFSAISTPFNIHGRPTWSSDDSGIISYAIKEGQKNLFLFPLAGGEPTQLTENGGIVGKLHSNGDLYFTRQDSTIWVKSLSSDVPALQLLKSEGFAARYLWELTEKGIYYFIEMENRYQIKFYDIATSTTSAVIDLPWLADNKYRSFSFVEDEELLLLTVEDFPQADIKKLTHFLLKE
ncbi:MAG: PD40 domain-containing protein [Colwellia sp.]|nr:winged helix-turn-helix domain-containing protein [Colwellia sp.]NQZ79678.1 PD40 domain-containing protein [Colwellia sp.]